MNSSVTVELANVGMRYGGRRLFGAIDAIVRPGECMAIVGHNGAGKSTLLKVIAGITRPTEGAVHLVRSGQKISSEERASVVGMVSPEIVFYNALSGLENLQFFSRLRGTNLGEVHFMSCLEQVGLLAHCNKPVAAYSTGMRQRLKFALLQVLQPSLILLDEPSSNLDTSGKAIVEQFIVSAIAMGKTIIIASNETWETAYASNKLNLS